MADFENIEEKLRYYQTRFSEAAAELKAAKESLGLLKEESKELSEALKKVRQELNILRTTDFINEPLVDPADDPADFSISVNSLHISAKRSWIEDWPLETLQLYCTLFMSYTELFSEVIGRKHGRVRIKEAVLDRERDNVKRAEKKRKAVAAKEERKKNPNLRNIDKAVAAMMGSLNMTEEQATAHIERMKESLKAKEEKGE